MLERNDVLLKYSYSREWQRHCQKILQNILRVILCTCLALDTITPLRVALLKKKTHVTILSKCNGDSQRHGWLFDVQPVANVSENIFLRGGNTETGY